MTDENLIDLGTGYFLAGFPDFESAFAATDKFCGKGLRVAYLNEAAHICEREVMAYAKRVAVADATKYKNYIGEQPAATATESVRTALEELEERNKFKIKYLIIFYSKAVKEPKLQARLL